jgi:phage terminase small subunit
MSRPTAPRGLSARSRRLWRDLNDLYAFELHDLELLELALGALDRAREAKALLDAEGLVVKGRYGARTHPAVAIERDSRLAAARLFRELGIDKAVEESRPPRRGGRR